MLPITMSAIEPLPNAPGPWRGWEALPWRWCGKGITPPALRHICLHAGERASSRTTNPPNSIPPAMG